MKNQAKLIFREWKKPEVAHELHGWRPEKSSVFVFDDKGQPQVLEFVLPAQLNEQDRPMPVFPQHSPADVTEIRLVPPPCRTDQGEAHTLRVRAKANTDAAGAVFPSANWDPSRWELVRLSCDKEILILKPEDDGPLLDLLNKFKEEKHHEYEARKQEIHMLLELARNRQPICGRARYYAHIVSNSCEAPSPDSAAVWLYLVGQERIKLDMDFGQGGYEKGFLQWTLEDARRHHDIRDPYLQSKWAKENGLDLQELADQRKQIAAWTGLDEFVVIWSKPLRKLFGDSFEAHAPHPNTLAMAKASELEFGASVRFRVAFAAEHQEAWLTACRMRGPEPDELAEFGAAQERIVTLETIKGDHRQVLRKLDSVDKKTDQVLSKTDQALSGIKTLTELAGEQAATRDKWAENPLGSREGSADYLLAMRVVGIKGERASALVHFGYGETRVKCAQMAGVSIESIKRDLVRARQTPYAKFFARTRQQRLEARKAMKKPDDAFARLSQLAKEDPDKLRAITDQLIAKAQRESDGGNAWDRTVAGML